MLKDSHSPWWLLTTLLTTIVFAGAAHGRGSNRCPNGDECVRGTHCTSLLPDTGSYGCCPYERGVPCEPERDNVGAAGNLHRCCPEGHRCLNKACVGDEGGHTPLYPPASMVAPRRRKLRSTTCRPRETVKCQDGSSCPAGDSCCHTPEYPAATYSCCPYSYAQVCCPDGSCCPAGYRCDSRWEICVLTLRRGASHNRSVDSGLRRAIPALRGTPARLPSSKHTDGPWLECPDSSFCHRGSTCCPSAPSRGGSRYACCPHQEAQCCHDRENCCPHGTRCMRSAMGHHCEPSGGQRLADPQLASKKYPSFAGLPGDSDPTVPCPMWMVCGTASCCRNQYGAYRCAPYAGGVCCAEGISGCPPGTECYG